MGDAIEVHAEPWTDQLWSQLKPLAEAHFEEVDGGVEPRRKLDLDLDLMRAMAAHDALLVVVARAAGEVVGYFTWQIALDIESRGLLVGFQGAWFVAPGYPGAAARLFDVSVEELRARGVKHVFPHHRAQGRGASIGRFFRRRGAKLIQFGYSLWIGE